MEESHLCKFLAGRAAGLLGVEGHGGEQLGLVVDYRYGTCYSYDKQRFLDVTWLPSRHLAINLAPSE